MAVTSGQGNPKWTQEETVLALRLYFECAGKPPSPDDLRVLHLSTLLRSLPIHARHKKNPTFRNPDGVSFKLQNIRAVATGVGLQNVSQVDRQVWKEFGNNRARVERLCRAIVDGLAVLNTSIDDTDAPDDDEIFSEGRILTTTHKRRERNPKLRRKLLLLRKAQDSLRCDICSRDDYSSPDRISMAIFEAHHTVPLGEGRLRTTRLSELALLCANCHRAIHRLIASEKKWINIIDARKIIKP